ncbi:MAG: lipid-A-disaccharide synthase [Deltaproteobacteria bacterium]|jgi:lipid-A-disaccharide synthase|nr:lipid-A-disaccharide synthase [Deltaproteobacteria bacterium]
MKLWISAGEISGDLHGSFLCGALRRLRPEARLMGMGGPRMRALAFESIFQAEELSVMGFTEVLSHLPRIFRLLKNIKARLRQERPDALVVIDAPDFHFRLIPEAERLGIPIYYYISPKVWAWRQGRAKFIKRHVRRLISILPFEVDFYRRFGLEADYVGNPLLDQLDLPALDQIRPRTGWIGLMPGSRRKEISLMMPAFAQAARLMLALKADLRFICAPAPSLDEKYVRSFWPEDIPLYCRPPEERYAFMRECEMLLAASGTAVLESALIGTPTLITYRGSALSFRIAKAVVKVPYVGLPNLICGREIMPELLQDAGSGPNLAALAARWLELPGADSLNGSGDRTFAREVRPKFSAECGNLEQVRRNLADLRQLVGKPGAAQRAAGIILEDLAAAAAP